MLKFANYPHLANVAKKETKKINMEVDSRASKDYISMHRVQTAQLQHDKRKEKPSRKNGNKEVL